ncbi:MAG: hypothetical protein ACLFRO_08415 [Desulfobacterales bacterium]
MKKILIALLIVGFAGAAPAMAADFDFYGSFRTHLGYYSVDEDYAGGPGRDSTIGHGMEGVDDDSGTTLTLGGNSTFGADIGVSENIYGKIETGIEETTTVAEVGDDDDDVVRENDVYLREAYGVWNFGEGELLAGKTYTPGTFAGYSKISGNLGSGYDGAMFAAGIPYIDRQPQVRLTFGGFEFALIEANTGAPDYKEDVPDNDKMDKDFTLPRMEAAYTHQIENITLRGIAGYQTYDIEGYENVGTEEAPDWEDKGSESIDSYHVGLGGKMDFDPAYVNAGISYGQNPGNYGNSNLLLIGPSGGKEVMYAQYVDDGDKEDATLMEGILVAGFQATPMVNLEAGVGYMSGEVDAEHDEEVNTVSQTSMLYYAQAWISMNETFHIIPEIGMVNRGDVEYDHADTDDLDNGDMTYFDVSFRYEF